MRSVFIDSLFALARYLRNSITGSATLATLLSFLVFTERAFYASRFRALLLRLPFFYPARVWGFFDSMGAKMAKSRLARIDLFNPVLIFPLAFSAFVGLSAYRASNIALASIAVGLASFVVGAKIGRRAEFKNIYLEGASRKIVTFLLSAGLLFMLADLLYAGSIPLLDPLARRYLNVTYTMLASLTVPGAILAISIVGGKAKKGEIGLSAARSYAAFITVASTLIMSLLGYRTQMMVSLLGCTIAMFYGGIIGIAEIILAFFAAAAGLSTFGYVRALQQGSQIGMAEVIGKRIGLTMSVYDWLVNRFWLFGVNHGYTALATFTSFLPIPGPKLGPRTIVASIFGISGISMTSTLYGTVVLDFGIPGIAAFSLVFGALLGLAYKAVRQTGSPLAIAVFALLMAYSLVGVETGLVDFNVAFFFFAGAVILINSIKSWS